ncbi:MAG: DNA polymerase III subunit gamma/tau [Atopobiaceae bacterium]|nr:DNA polymerase III subunit gamma/tau [Atopobiaceae bacterium]
MESLYRLYRPQTFGDVVGQTHVVDTLSRAVTEKRVGHAYLFSGPRGTGKTTMARILAKALMCSCGEGQLPDGSCEQCTKIADGTHPDVYELDAASRTGVDNVREEIINSVAFAPIEGRPKVYLIDEVHMLTTSAFNALLKTLEEPPAHVVFILCTTDPQKIMPTILSRVQRFDFHAISASDMRERLAYVCEREGFSYEDGVLDLICEHARGGMRDALNDLEQLSVFCDRAITVDAVRDMLGELPATRVDAIMDALARRDVATMFGALAALVAEGYDLSQLAKTLAQRTRDLLVLSMGGTLLESDEMSAEETARLSAQAQAFGTAARLSRTLEILGDCMQVLKTSTNQRLDLEIALTRAARPDSELTLAALAERIAELEARVSSPPVAAVAAPSAPAAAVAAPSSTPTAAPVPSTPTAALAPSTPASPAPPAPTPASTSAASATPSTPAPPAPTPESPAAAPVPSTPASPAPPAPTPESPADPVQASVPAPLRDAAEISRAWTNVVTDMAQQHPSKGTLLIGSHASATSDDELAIELPAGNAFVVHMVDKPDYRETLMSFVRPVFGNRELRFKVAQTNQPSHSSEATQQVAPAPVQTSAPQQAGHPQLELPTQQQAQPETQPIPQAAQTPQAPQVAQAPQAVQAQQAVQAPQIQAPQAVQAQQIQTPQGVQTPQVQTPQASQALQTHEIPLAQAMQTTQVPESNPYSSQNFTHSQPDTPDYYDVGDAGYYDDEGVPVDYYGDESLDYPDEKTPDSYNTELPAVPSSQNLPFDDESTAQAVASSVQPTSSVPAAAPTPAVPAPAAPAASTPPAAAAPTPSAPETPVSAASAPETAPVFAPTETAPAAGTPAQSTPVPSPAAEAGSSSPISEKLKRDLDEVFHGAAIRYIPPEEASSSDEHS